METGLWKFVHLACNAPWLPAIFERVIERQKTIFLGPLKSPKNMFRKSILIDLFVLNNNRTIYRRIKISSGRVGKALVLAYFFMASYGQHRKLGVGFCMAGYGRHSSQWVKPGSHFFKVEIWNYVEKSNHLLIRLLGWKKISIHLQLWQEEFLFLSGHLY